MERGLFNHNFDPIVQPEEYVVIKTTSGDIYGKVTWIEPLPFIQVDFGAIAAEGFSSVREMQELYVYSNEFAQYRFVIQTDNVFLYKHWCPKAGVYYSTEKEIAQVPYAALYGSVPPVGPTMQLTEFYQWQDTKRYMQLINIGTTDVDHAYMVFYGYVFDIEPLSGAPSKPYTVIPAVARTGIKTSP